MDYGAIARLEQRLRSFVDVQISKLLDFSLLASASAMGETDTSKTEDIDNEHQRTIRRSEPWGFRGRPMTTGVRGVILRPGGGESGILVGVVTDTRWGKVDLDGGESAQYSGANPAIVHGAKSGKTTLTSTDGADSPAVKNKVEMNADGSATFSGVNGATAILSWTTTGELTISTPGSNKVIVNAGGDVELTGGGKVKIEPKAEVGGSSKEAAYKDGAVNDGSLTLTVGGGATLAWSYTDPDGSTTSGASGAAITLKGKITDGSAKLKMGT